MKKLDNELHVKRTQQLLKLNIDLRNALQDKDIFLLKRQISILKDTISRDIPIFHTRQVSNTEKTIVQNGTSDRIGHYIRVYGHAWWRFDDPAYLWQDTAKTVAVTADADPIKVCQSRIGNYDFVAVSDDARFEYKTGIVNELSIGRSDGTDDHMAVATMSIAQPYIIIQVIHNSGGGEGFQGVIRGTTGYTAIVQDYGTTKVKMYSGTGFVLTAAGAVPVSGETKYQEGLVSGAASTLLADGVTVSGVDTGSAAFTTPTIGVESRSTPEYDAIDFCELVILDGNIPSDILTLIRDDIKLRWVAV